LKDDTKKESGISEKMPIECTNNTLTRKDGIPIAAGEYSVLPQ
jgi:hypothetical protein